MSSHLAPVHEPAYTMSTETSPSSSSIGTPFPGSPGVATMGRNVEASIVIVPSYDAFGSLNRPWA